MKDIEKIFILSPINGALYYDPEPVHWEWPRDTWFQKRRERVVEREEQCQTEQQD